MLLRPSRLVVGCVAVAVAAFVVPLAARTLAVASAGPEVVLAPPSFAAASGSAYGIGTDGTNFAVLESLGMQRVSPTGALLDLVAIPFPYSTAVSSLAVAPSASGYICAWSDRTKYGVLVAHLDSALAPVDTNPTTVTAFSPADSAVVALAKGATGYLVSWIDENDSETAGTIYAQLLDGSGVPVGSALTLGPGFAFAYGPTVAYGGGNYEVLWGTGTSLFAVRVSDAGVLLDTAPATLTSSFESYSAAPVIAATPTEYVLVWDDSGHSGAPAGIYGARLAFDGTVLDSGGVYLLPSGQPNDLAYAPGLGLVLGWTQFGAKPPSVGILDEAALSIMNTYVLPGAPYGVPLYGSPKVASNGTTVLAAWTGQTLPAAATIGPMAAPSSTPVTLGWVAGHNGASQIASSGSGYFVAWQTNALNASGAIWGRLLDASGAPLGEPVLVALPSSVGDPVVVWTGAEYVVLFQVNQGTWDTVRVDPAGNVLDSTVENIDIPPGTSQIAFTGGNDQFFEIVVTGQEVDIDTLDGTPGAIFASKAVSKILFTATQASVTWLDATRFEVAFVGGAGLYASVFDTTTLTAKDPVTIASTPSGYAQPLAAHGENETLVAATPPDGGSMFVYRLDGTGALIDGPYPTQLTAGASATSLVWDGARYVMAWSRASSDGGTVAYASDLGSAGSPFALSGALQPFSENILPAGPAIVSLGDGGALLVATRANASDTSVVGVPWTSGDKLPPLPGPDAGSDAGPDAGAGTSGDAGGDAATDAGVEHDAGNDSGTTGDASGPLDSGPPPVVITSDAGEDAGIAGPVEDSGVTMVDASAPDEDGGEASSGAAGASSGCSCRLGPEGSTTPWPALAAALLACFGLARRRRAPMRFGVPRPTLQRPPPARTPKSSAATSPPARF